MPSFLTVADIRREVLLFAVSMEAELQRHENKRGPDGRPQWKSETVDVLLRRLVDEVAELSEAIASAMESAEAVGGLVPEVVGEIVGEAADIANFCMFIADVCTVDIDPDPRLEWPRESEVREPVREDFLEFRPWHDIDHTAFRAIFDHLRVQVGLDLGARADSGEQLSRDSLLSVSMPIQQWNTLRRLLEFTARGEGAGLLCVLPGGQESPVDADQVQEGSGASGAGAGAVAWVREHDRPVWHRCTDQIGLRVACGELISGSPLVQRIGEPLGTIVVEKRCGACLNTGPSCGHPVCRGLPECAHPNVGSHGT